MNKIQMLYDYYHKTRASGHTSLMLVGAQNYDRDFILVGDNPHFLSKAINHNAHITTIEGLDRSLIGTRNPIIFDNGGMLDLLRYILKNR